MHQKTGVSTAKGTQKLYLFMHKGNENFESKLDRWSSSGRKDYHQRLFPVNRGNESSWMSDSSQVSSPLQGYSIPCDKKPQETARDLLGPSFWKNSDSSLGQSSSLFSRDWTNSNDEPDPFDAESTESRPSPLKVLLESRPNVPDSSDYAVIKICNIQWDTTHQEIREFFEPHCIPRHHLAPYYMEGIHMILNRETGRTLYECFIEIPEKDTALDILQDKSRKRQALNGKLVRLEMSSQRELRMALFPRMTIEREKTGIQQGAVYLQRDEISFLLQQCRSMRYQSPRRSKANDRPYENIISVISKIPWHDEDGISTLFRDHVFEMLKCINNSCSIC
jgi:hypothetical protein